MAVERELTRPVDPDEVKPDSESLFSATDGERLSRWSDLAADEKLQMINLQADVQRATVEEYRDHGESIEVALLTDDMQVIKEEFDYPTTPSGSRLERFLSLIGVPGELLSDPELSGVEVPVREEEDRWVIDYDGEVIDDEADEDQREEAEELGDKIPNYDDVVDALLYPMSGAEARYVTFLVSAVSGVGIGALTSTATVVAVFGGSIALLATDIVSPDDSNPKLGRVFLTYGGLGFLASLSAFVTILFLGLF